MCMYIINASEIYAIISPYQGLGSYQGLGYARLVENANEWRINLTQSYLPNLECLLWLSITLPVGYTVQLKPVSIVSMVEQWIESCYWQPGTVNLDQIVSMTTCNSI